MVLTFSLLLNHFWIAAVASLSRFVAAGVVVAEDLIGAAVRAVEVAAVVDEVLGTVSCATLRSVTSLQGSKICLRRYRQLDRLKNGAQHALRLSDLLQE